MARQSDPQHFQVSLRTDDERQRWNKLVGLNVQPSPYPDWETVQDLGIRDNFEELCTMGKLSKLFDEPHDSYRAITLEFLSTLNVQMKGNEVDSIYFRLQNRPLSLSIADFNNIFSFYGEGVGITEEPERYDRDEFWNAITLPEGRKRSFNPSRAKSSRIRNPVLRYMQKALAYLPFARFAVGSVQTDELFVLWSLLHQQPLNMGHFVIRFLERQAKKTPGTICCGGIITSLALSFDVGLDGYVADPGLTKINHDVLKQTKFINVDTRNQGYILQKAGDHFPFPDPENTSVRWWTFKANWLMNEEVHNNITRSNPPDWTNPNVPRDMPVSQVPELEQRPGDGEVEASNGRRRRRRRRRRRKRELALEKEAASLKQRLIDLQGAVQQGFDQQNTDRKKDLEWRQRMEHMMASMYDSWHPHQPRPHPH